MAGELLTCSAGTSMIGGAMSGRERPDRPSYILQDQPREEDEEEVEERWYSKTTRLFTLFEP
jgi:hypothetical protein